MAWKAPGPSEHSQECTFNNFYRVSQLQVPDRDRGSLGLEQRTNAARAIPTGARRALAVSVFGRLRPDRGGGTNRKGTPTRSVGA